MQTWVEGGTGACRAGLALETCGIVPGSGVAGCNGAATMISTAGCQLERGLCQAWVYVAVTQWQSRDVVCIGCVCMTCSVLPLGVVCLGG